MFGFFKVLTGFRQTLAGCEPLAGSKPLSGCESRKGKGQCNLWIGALNPALVRSRIKSRSNWLSAPNTWKMSRPPGVVVSMLSVSDRKPTPRASSAPIVSIRCGRERPSRAGLTWPWKPCPRKRARIPPCVAHPSVRRCPVPPSIPAHSRSVP